MPIDHSVKEIVLDFAHNKVTTLYKDGNVTVDAVENLHYSTITNYDSRDVPEVKRQYWTSHSVGWQTGRDLLINRNKEKTE